MAKAPVGFPRRGTVYWVDIKPEHTAGTEQFGKRPWLVVSADAVNVKGKLVIAVPLTKQLHHQPGMRDARIQLPTNERKHYDDIPDVMMLKDVPSLVLTEQVRALSRSRLGLAIAEVTPGALRAVETGLLHVLDLS